MKSFLTGKLTQQNTGNAGEGHLHSSEALSLPIVDLPTATLAARSWCQFILAEHWISFREPLEEAHLCHLEKHCLGVFCTLVPSEFSQASLETSQRALLQPECTATNQGKLELRYGWPSALPEGTSWGKWKRGVKYPCMSYLGSGPFPRAFHLFTASVNTTWECLTQAAQCSEQFDSTTGPINLLSTLGLCSVYMLHL